MDSDESVIVKVVPNEEEAIIACGLLETNGIECGYRETDAIDSPYEDFIDAGPREILVREADLEAARALLAPADA
jgi:hypothetical protein